MKDLKPSVRWHLTPRFGKKIFTSSGSPAWIGNFPIIASDRINGGAH